MNSNLAFHFDYTDYAVKMGTEGDIFQTILDDYEKLGLVGEETNKLMAYLAATSRLMEKPLNILVLSSSGAGKSALQDKTLKLMPPESVIRVSAITDKALYYQKSLKNKLLALEEAAGVKDSYAIRTLISEGYLAQETVSGNQGQSLHVEGGCSIFQTTTNPEINPETKSRFFILGVDESREQTRRILELQRQAQTLEGLKTNNEVTGIIGKHHSFQRLLEPFPVVNPYAPELIYEDDRLQARRNQPKFLQLINTIAFLRQMQKPVKRYEGIEYIEVDRTDIDMAVKLASELLGISLDDLSIPARNLLQLLTEMKQPIFTRAEVMNHTGWCKSRLHAHLTELIEMELVVPQSAKKNSLHTYKLLYNGEGQDGHKFCIGLAPVQ